MERFKSNLSPLPERVTGEAAGTYLKRRESWIQQKADMKRLQGTNRTLPAIPSGITMPLGII